MRASDQLVIGGGVIGLACAWRLAREGVDVRLLEAGRVGGGSTAAALGALMPASPLREGAIQRLQWPSLWSFGSFCEELEKASGSRVLYEQRGRIELIGSEKRHRRAREEVEAARVRWPMKDGLPALELLDRDKGKRREPRVSFGEWGALLCRLTAQVETGSLVSALREACVAAGVRIEEGRRVDSLIIVCGRVRGARCGAEEIPSGGVLVTAGTGVAGLGAPLDTLTPVVPVKGQALLLRVEDPMISFLVKGGGTYLMRRGDHHLLVGATTEPEAKFDDTATEEAREKLISGASEILPDLAMVEVEEHLVGLRPAAPDRRPWLGAVPGIDGLHVAAGHYKIGLALAPVTAEILADLIVRGRTKHDIARFAIPR
ncbi:MAG: NAD(P)/FAD-dependent oxidoreductase [Planctomycetota bacterium]